MLSVVFNKSGNLHFLLIGNIVILPGEGVVKAQLIANCVDFALYGLIYGNTGALAALSE